MGIANALAALDIGVRNFDACLAGLGGCPYAPGATGNVVMEDLVFMLESMGLKTGVDLEKLIAVRKIIERALPAVPLNGNLAKAGLPKGFRPASPARHRATA
jgi:hydroxymethylglutaryl-CoA lyase